MKMSDPNVFAFYIISTISRSFIVLSSILFYFTISKMIKKDLAIITN